MPPQATRASRRATSTSSGTAVTQQRRGRQQGNDRQGNHEGQQASHNGGNGTYGNGGNRNSNRRRNRRDRRQEQQVELSLTRDEVSLMKVAELREKAQSLGIPYVGVRKKDLAEAVYEAAASPRALGRCRASSRCRTRAMASSARATTWRVMATPSCTSSSSGSTAFARATR